MVHLLDSSMDFATQHEHLFDHAMGILDSHFALPLLWKSPKASSWYAVGLLARSKGHDNELAGRLLTNVLATQYLDAREETYGTFPHDYTQLAAKHTGLIKPLIYETFDPNNGLFVTMACILIHAKYRNRITPELNHSLVCAMRIAVDGDAMREGGMKGDNLYPAYSNLSIHMAWFMRCICSAYVAAILDDEKMARRAEYWAQEAVDLFQRHGTVSEFNSGTYTGVTMFALGLAQFLPHDTTLYRYAPKILGALWDQTAEIYNPSLRTLSGPWDRTYGFDLTQYCGILGTVITALVGRDNAKAVDGCNHIFDLAIVPMQMLVAPYVEAQLSADARAKFHRLYAPHSYTTQAVSPPFDRSPRVYTFWLEDGLSAGGVSFRQSDVGGACLNPEQFAPGVILWDAGKDNPGVGWISYYPSSSCATIAASPGRMSISYPYNAESPDSEMARSIQLDISSFAWFELSDSSFTSNRTSLPGLEIELSGSAVAFGSRRLKYGPGRHGARHYSLIYTVDRGTIIPPACLDLEIRWKRSPPPGPRFC